jgi:heme-degrading monooxygenase HmoA
MEAIMYVRLVYCKFSPENIQDAKRIYREEIVPVVLKQKGIIDIQLLEPVDQTEDYISITQWKTKTDADAYESSGTYKKLVSKLESFFTKQPVLKVFNVEKVTVPTS